MRRRARACCGSLGCRALLLFARRAPKIGTESCSWTADNAEMATQGFGSNTSARRARAQRVDGWCETVLVLPASSRSAEPSAARHRPPRTSERRVDTYKHRRGEGNRGGWGVPSLWLGCGGGQERTTRHSISAAASSGDIRPASGCGAVLSTTASGARAASMYCCAWVVSRVLAASAAFFFLSSSFLL